VTKSPQESNNPLVSITGDMAAHPLVPIIQLCGTIIGIAVLVFGNGDWVKVTAALGVALCVITLYFTTENVRLLAEWLTWKFVLGFVICGITVVLLLPQIESLQGTIVSSAIPQAEVAASTPQDGGTLTGLSAGIRIYFSRAIPTRYQASRFLTLQIAPDTPLNAVWLYDYDPQSCCEQLEVRSDRYYPDGGFRFEPNTTHHLRLSGPLLNRPADITFHTPQK
jgi:hypothetical protein